MSNLIQKQAPDFTAAAVLPDDKLVEDFSLASLRGKYVALFFYPLDFTFVCPSEILAFDHRLEQFSERSCAVVGVSVDSQFTHLAWRNTPVEEGGIGKVRFPLVADLTKRIARDFGVLADDSVAFRATFLIDREGVVRHQTINDLGLGRNVDDTIRTLDALQHLEKTGHVCPANWKRGEESMSPSRSGVARYLRTHGSRI